MADYLTELDEHYHSGDMGPGQVAEYRALRDKLKDLLPLIERLDFYPPPVALDG